jgi:hypothetical protein
VKTYTDKEYSENKKFLDSFMGVLPPKEEMTSEERRKLAGEFFKNKNRSDIFMEYGMEGHYAGPTL